MPIRIWRGNVHLEQLRSASRVAQGWAALFGVMLLENGLVDNPRHAAIGARTLHGGLHARTIEILDQRGVADRFLSQGRKVQVASFARIPLDIADFLTRHNYGLALWQRHTG